nr:7-cyano-7-deazaguanine synthase QueC [Desulfobulbaceae bacterium]
MSEQKKAVILLSGGLDSTTVLAIALDQGYSCYCLSFSYGQRQTIELEKAAAIAAQNGARHLVLDIGLGKIGGSALTDAIDVPKDPIGSATAAGAVGKIPVTYVPGRNTIFLSYAMAWAEVVGAWDIFIGVNAMDYSGYPDCRPEFLQQFEKLAKLATKSGVSEDRYFKINAPLMHLTKKEIIIKGLSLGVDYSMTHSCYDPDVQGRACGRCEACQLRLKGFAQAGRKDSIHYQVGE